jgi:uncharacterized lipoprotein YddW (UPF0748 family)
MRREKDLFRVRLWTEMVRSTCASARWVLAWSFALALFWPPSLPADVLVKESRVILDENFDWLTRDTADNVLARIKRAGFNVFVPVIWHGRGTAWPSTRAPKEPRWEDTPHDAEHDPLAYLIRKAHQLGVEVHPWFTVALRQRDFLPQFYDTGTPKEAFNIHLPEFRQFITDLMLEVVNRYDVDGINLDYVRSGMSDCSSRNYYCDVCLSDYCARDYQKRSGNDLRHDMNAVRATTDPAAYAGIAAWNGAAMDDIISHFSASARAIKPKLIISVDTHAGYPWTVFQGADAIKWANKGWIDVLFHMEYGAFEKFRWPLIHEAIAKLSDPDQFVLLVANFEVSRFNKGNVWARDAKLVLQLVEYSQKFRPSGNGAALYQYAHLTDEQIELLRRGPFKLPATPNWKKNRARE